MARKPSSKPVAAVPTLGPAERLMALFEGRAGAHGTHGEPRQRGLKWEIKTTARTVHEPVTLELWAFHLAGERPLGVITIREDSTCLWGSIDVDLYDADLLKIVADVEARGLPLVPCRSKSGGLHLFLFLSRPQPAAAMRAVLKDLAARLGLAGCEIFPVQSEVLTERGDVGNWMVMPYYGDTFGGRLREQAGVKRTGSDQTVGEFLSHAEGARLDPSDFAALQARLAADLNGTTPRPGPDRGGNGRAAHGSAPTGGEFGDGCVCLQHLVAGGPMSDGRKRTIFMMGLYYKRADPANWQERLDRANHLFFSPPLPPDEVKSALRSLSKKEFEYTCRVEPMASHCNAGLCRTRRFGVGGKGQYPVITGLSKLDTDPPVWFLDVDDQRFEATTEQLLNYGLMQRLFAARGNRVYRNMRASDWVDALVEPMEGAVMIAAPPDAGAPGHFHEVLEDFLVNRWRGESRADLLRGKPWEDTNEGRHYFRLKDLQLQLMRLPGLRDLTRGQIVRHIERLGGTHHQFHEKGHNIACWWVPSDAVQSTPRLDVPQDKGEVL